MDPGEYFCSFFRSYRTVLFHSSYDGKTYSLFFCRTILKNLLGSRGRLTAHRFFRGAHRRFISVEMHYLMRDLQSIH